MAKTDLTAQRLRELLHYDPETGKFRQLVRTSGRRNVGAEPGCISRGRRLIRIDYKLIPAARLAWLYVTGEWPKQQVDHIDGDPMNDRFANLRDVSQTLNLQNLRVPGRNNSSGFLGVSFDRTRRKWQSSIYIDRRCVFLGRFDTAELAHAAYVEAKREHHPGCTI
jgi:hypothetical protein